MTDKLTIIGPVICAVVYVITGLAFGYEKRPGWSLCYIAYALANIGLIWASISEKT